MKYLFPGLCWAVLVGGMLMACSKKPLPPRSTPAAPAGVPYEEDQPVTHPDEGETREVYFTPIYFEFNSAIMRDAWKAAALAKYLLMSGRPVFLAGHTSDEGTDAYNLALGERRAQAVRGYLEAAGVPSNRITFRSFGEENPLSDDPAKKALNRRVEITLEDPL